MEEVATATSQGGWEQHVSKSTAKCLEHDKYLIYGKLIITTLMWATWMLVLISLKIPTLDKFSYKSCSTISSVLRNNSCIIHQIRTKWPWLIQTCLCTSSGSQSVSYVIVPSASLFFSFCFKCVPTHLSSLMLNLICLLCAVWDVFVFYNFREYPK